MMNSKKEHRRPLPLRVILAYGLVMLGSSCLNNIFVTYYIELFCYIFEISSSWFFAGQILFMIWNTVNDPVFGVLSDWLVTNKGKKSQMRRRANSIMWGGLWWAVAFILVWFPPSQSDASPGILGLYFTFCLCFYDGLLTFVELNHSAVLSEVTTDVNERAKCNLSSAAFATLGSMTSFFGHYYWDRENLNTFRLLCLAIAFLATASFYLSAQLLKQPHEKFKKVVKKGSSVRFGKHSSSNDDSLVDTGTSAKSGTSLRTELRSSLHRSIEAVRDLWQSQNGRVYAIVHCLQCFDCTFQKNFFPIFLTHFAAGQVSQSTLSVVVASSFVLPWLATSAYTAIVQARGLHKTLEKIFSLRLFVLSVCLFFSTNNMSAQLSCALLLLNRVLSESVCRLSPLVVADLVDEDICLHERKSTVAATVVGSAGSFGKISQSLAPIVGYLLIPSAGVRPASLSHVSSVPDDEGDGVLIAESASLLKDTSLGTVIALLLLCVVSAQKLLWSQYTLRGDYLSRIKKDVAEAKMRWGIANMA